MKIEWKTCLRVGISIFVLFLCIHYWTFMSGVLKTILGASIPFIVGGALAYPLNILMSFYERHIFKNSKSNFAKKARTGICLVLTILTLLVIVAIVVALIVPQITNCVKLLIDKIPGAIENIIAFASTLDFIPEDIFDTIANVDWKSKLGEIISTVTSGIGSAVDVVKTAVSSVVSVVTSAVISIMFAIYLLLSRDKIFSQVDKVVKYFIKDTLYNKIKYILSVADTCFRKFIVGQCTEAVILGALCAVGMFILRLPYAAMMGAVTAFTALIPIVGALIGGAIGVFLIFIESPVKALVFLIFIVVLQQLEGDLIYPKVVGSSIGLPGIWVFTAATLGAGVFGILGMIISVPLAATAYRLLGNELNGKGMLLKKRVSEGADLPLKSSEQTVEDSNT